MEGNQFASGDDTGYRSYKLSWLAYLKTILGAVFMMFLVLIMSSVWLSATAEHIGLHRFFVFVTTIVSIAIVAVTIYRILCLKALELYTDDAGIWVYRGILPWKRGTMGVKWRDLEDAIYYTGFASWVFRSYTIRVGHRFTKTSEIVIRDVAQGHAAVEHINQRLREKIVGESI